MEIRCMIPLSVPNFEGNEQKYVQDAVGQGWVSTGGAYITKLEEENGEVDLSSCKIEGGDGKPYAILSLLRENHSLKEL